MPTLKLYQVLFPGDTFSLLNAFTPSTHHGERTEKNTSHQCVSLGYFSDISFRVLTNVNSQE